MPAKLNGVRRIEVVRGVPTPRIIRNFQYLGSNRKIRIADTKQSDTMANRELDSKENALIAKLDRGASPAEEHMTVNDLADKYVAYTESNASESTYISYELHLRRYIKGEIVNKKLGNTRLVNLTSKMIKEAYEAVFDTTSFSTLEHVHRIFNSMMNWACVEEIILTNPIGQNSKKYVAGKRKAYKKDKPERLLSNEWMNMYWNEIKGTDAEIIFHLQTFHSLRIGEAEGFKYEDVDFENDTISVKRQVQHGNSEAPLKTPNSYRTIPLNPDTKELLLGTYPQEGFVFKTSTGTACSTANYYRDVHNPINEKLGLDIKTQEFRKYFGSALLTEGTSIMRVSKLMGHASPAVTLKIYAKLIDDLDNQPINVAAVLKKSA